MKLRRIGCETRATRFEAEVNWMSSTASFLGGVGLGVGLGMLFAPVSGEDARAAIRDSPVETKNRVGDMAAGSGVFHSPGTEGD